MRILFLLLGLLAALPAAVSTPPAKPATTTTTPAATSAAPVTDRLPATIEVDAVLIAKSDPPPPERIATYQEALGIYVWQVTGSSGPAIKAGDKIAVSHWLVRRNLAQEITKSAIAPPPAPPPPGKKPPKLRTTHLKLRPWADVAGVLQTVEMSDTASEPGLTRWHDVGQNIQLPKAGDRWDYTVDVSEKMPLFFRLKDQLKLVAIGDCQAWFANKAELYYGDENRASPVAFNLCQQRSCLDYQRMIVEDYLVKLPKLEWVVLTWNPRFVNGTWNEHGRKLAEYKGSRGYAYDKANAAEVWKPGPGPLTTAQILKAPEFSAIWSMQPWGWVNVGPADARQQSGALNEARGEGRRRPSYNSVEARWQSLTTIIEALKAKNVKLIIFTTPVHPEMKNFPVRDKSNIPAEGITAQNVRLKELETKYPGTVFFFDLNNNCDNGLDGADFVNIDHVSGTGAQKVTERVEAFRKQCAAKKP